MKSRRERSERNKQTSNERKKKSVEPIRIRYYEYLIIY